MPAYKDPKSNLGQINYATIGRPVYLFGFDNNSLQPQGPPAPVKPVLTVFTNVGATLAGTGNLFVTTTYVYPGSSPATVSPNSLPQGFPSLTANIACPLGKQVNIAAIGNSLDVGQLAIGYNVFAGFNGNVNLINTSVIPIGTAYAITSNAISVLGGVTVNVSSRTNTYTPEVITSNVASIQFGIPVSGSNFVGNRNISWRVGYGNGTPASASVALQVAYQDNANSYMTVDSTANTAGDFRTITNVSAKFFRAIITGAAGNANAAISTVVTVQVS